MGSAFHMLCPRHGDSLQITAATADKAMRTLTFNLRFGHLLDIRGNMVFYGVLGYGV